MRLLRDLLIALGLGVGVFLLILFLLPAPAPPAVTTRPVQYMPAEQPVAGLLDDPHAIVAVVIRRRDGSTESLILPTAGKRGK